MYEKIKDIQETRQVQKNISYGRHCRLNLVCFWFYLLTDPFTHSGLSSHIPYVFEGHPKFYLCSLLVAKPLASVAAFPSPWPAPPETEAGHPYRQQVRFHIPAGSLSFPASRYTHYTFQKEGQHGPTQHTAQQAGQLAVQVTSRSLKRLSKQVIFSPFLRKGNNAISAKK
jgi:hypothetical protein